MLRGQSVLCLLVFCFSVERFCVPALAEFSGEFGFGHLFSLFSYVVVANMSQRVRKGCFQCYYCFNNYGLA